MSITIRTGGAREPEVNLGDFLPIRYEEGANTAGGIGLLLFGGVFFGFPVVFLGFASAAARIQDGEPIPLFAYLLLAVFMLVGLGIMTLGVSALLHRLSITIDAEGVRGSRRGLKGTYRWHDPLGAYRGVLGEEEHRSGGKNRASYTLYKVVLKHAEEGARDVLLYRSRSSKNHRGETERFAKLLARPVLVERADGSFAQRAVEDLDKSVRELVEAGKLDARFNPSNPPPSHKLTMRREPSGYVFEHHYRGLVSVLMSLAFLGVGLGLLYWYFGLGLPADAQGSPWVVVVVGLVFAALGSFATVFSLYATSTLRVAPGELRGYTALFGWTMTDARLCANSVEEVAVRKDKRHQLSLHVCGDKGSLRFGGQALAVTELEYIRDCVIATLSGSPRAYRPARP